MRFVFSNDKPTMDEALMISKSRLAEIKAALVETESDDIESLSKWLENSLNGANESIEGGLTMNEIVWIAFTAGIMESETRLQIGMMN